MKNQKINIYECIFLIIKRYILYKNLRINIDLIYIIIRRNKFYTKLNKKINYVKYSKKDQIN